MAKKNRASGAGKSTSGETPGASSLPLPLPGAGAGAGEGRGKGLRASASPAKRQPGKPSALLDTRVVYCGDCLEQLKELPSGGVDLVYIDPPFNSIR